MIQVSRNDGGSVAAPIKGAIPVPATGSWFHFAWVFNGTSDTLYINGVAGSTTPSHSSTTTGNGNNYIGTRVPSGNPFDGRLDEMRVAATARSANWISAQYASMNGTFSTLGNEQVVVTGGATADAMDRIDPVASGDATTAYTVVLDGSEWHYKKQLTFNNGSRNENLDNFPVLVHLTSTNFNFANAQSDGRDIRFFDADGTTPLSYEIESWNATAQQAHVWVKVPRINASSNTDSIWMEYGNPAATDAQSPAAVWSSNFRAVWHMDETSGTAVGDSTGNGWNGVASATVMRDLTGAVNGADGYVDGVGYTSLSSGAIIPTGSTAFTFESWIWVGYCEEFDRIFTQSVNGIDYQVLWYNDRVEVMWYNGSAIYPRLLKAAAPLPARRTWIHVAWVHSGTTDAIYVNGVNATVSPSSRTPVVGNGNYIAAHTASGHHFDGQLDEMRIATAARSQHWISAQYASMTDTFITYGAEQPIPSQNVTSVSFTQAPVFCKDFVMPANGNISARIYVASTEDNLPVNPAISATLKYGSTTFATLSAPTAQRLANGANGAGIYQVDWSGTVGSSPVTVPAGQAVTLEITTADSSPFAVLYDSADYPSRVSLPAETVIDIESLAIYDAPYPGGSPVGAIVAGATAYVRATVSDPFGAYDITGLDISIPEAGVTASLNDAEVVDVTSCTKTYEYVWRPPAEGSYSVAVTAHEGTEGITDTAATRLDVTFLDFGTPSTTEFTITNNGAATDTYDPDQTVFIRVIDLDQNTDPNVVETVTVTVTTSSGDTETITLYETGPNTGIFTAEVPANSTTDGGDEDGTLYAPPGTVLDVVYVDPNDPTDTSSDTAIVTQPSGTSGLAIQKQLADPSVTAVVVGDEVVYRVRVANTGTTVLDPVTLTDTYPIQLKFVSASPTADIHNATQRQVTWNNVGPLAVGGYREFELTFKAQTAANTAVNSATATYPGGSQSDSAAVEIVNAGHTVTKTLLSPSGGTASYGDIVEYRIVVTNTGTTRITLLPLEDAFSAAYLAYVPGSATTEPDGVGAGLLFWENIAAPGGLDVGGSITIDLKFKVVGAGTPIVNTAIADYSEDEHGNPVPPARDSDTNLVTTAGLISGHVWNDLNENGIGDSGEPRLKDVEIKLYTAGGDLITTTTTLGKDGYYEFPNLPDGDYIIVEVDPPGYKSTGDTQGANDNRIAVTVAGSGVYPNNDFCDVRMPIADYASISGTVWNDANRNGTADPDEVGVKGVTVALYKDANNNGEIDPGEEAVSHTQTDNKGGYAFSGLPAGSYVVVETDLPGYQSTGDVVGANDNQIPVSVSAGDKVTGRDFFDARSGTIEGHVWHDLNGDGVFDEADKAAGLEGVTVTLKTNGVVVATTTTAADGSYTFDNLPPGDYEIVQTDLPNWSSTMDADGTNDNSITVSLLDGGRSANNNFLDTLPAMVRGYVFIDTVNDLLRAKGDTTVTNALVRLMVDGVVIASTNTDAVGYYEFGSVPPGVVSVLVSRVNATLVDVPAEGHAAYGDERRNRAIASGEDAVIVHTVVSGAGILAGHPAETLNFGFRDHPLSTAIDIRLHATPEGVTIQLSTVNEAGCGDIVIYAWIDNAWAEVGRVPAWLVVGEGANTYSVTASRLVAGSAYYLRVIDEAGNLHLSLTPVTVDSLQVEAVRLDLQSVTLRFNTEPGRRYQVEVSTDLVTWRTEYVSAPTAKGWTPFATEPFMAGPGTHTEVRVPRNERSRAFFKIRRIE